MSEVASNISDFGAGDSCIALARRSLNSLLDWLDKNGKTSDQN